jgi:hypothetical protein
MLKQMVYKVTTVFEIITLFLHALGEQKQSLFPHSNNASSG